jgi:hypothetical protein
MVKRWSTTVGAAAVVALAVWALFYLLMPQAPLTAGETVVLVGAAAGAVLLVRALGGWLGRWRRR